MESEEKYTENVDSIRANNKKFREFYDLELQN